MEKKWPTRDSTREPLVKLLSFQITTIVLGFILLFSLTIIIDDLVFRFDNTGFANIFIYFEFPIKVCVGYLSIVALIVYNHRTKQTAKQIELADVQNNFANYFKHKEEFFKYADKNGSYGKSISNEEWEKLHNILFPKSLKGNYKVYFELLAFILVIDGLEMEERLEADTYLEKYTIFREKYIDLRFLETSEFSDMIRNVKFIKKCCFFMNGLTPTK